MRQHQSTYSSTRWKSGIAATTAAVVILSSMIISSEGRGSLNANDEPSVTGTGRKQISDINMLLPVSSCETCRKVSYQISAINGCYQWEVSHPNLIELDKIPSETHPECANVATIRAISTKSSKSLIWVSAKDKNSGQVLRCEVKLGLIKRLEIKTHLRQFYLNDYEHLDVDAYDEEGNMFNGLTGYRFDWNIESGNQNVKIVSWREAARTHSELSQEFELNKLQSEVLFLKGMKQGSAVVTVKLNEPSYEGVALSRVVLSITEPFVVIPQQTVYLLPTSKFQFQLAKVTLSNSNMTFLPISLPNKQYQWNVDNSSKGIIGEDGIFISKDKEGFASILVVDQNIANNTAESSIRVAFPQLIDVEISDITRQLVEVKLLLVDAAQKSFQDQLSISEWDNNWILVQDHYYLFKVNLYDADKHLIQLTDNIVIKNLIDADYFEIVKTNKISSEVIVKAKKPTPKNQKLLYVSSLVQIKSEFPRLTYNVDQTRMKSEKEIIITENVKISHPTDLILLPLLRSPVDENKFGEIWQLSAIGGSGYYQWSIIEEKVAQISGSGVLKSVDIGFTTVIVKDSLNQRNYHTIRVEVTQIASFAWLEDHIEVKKSSEQAVLNLIAFDKYGRKFTNCSSVEVSYELKGAGIVSQVQTPKKYETLQYYVEQNKYILNLKQRFDENAQAHFIQELPASTKLSQVAMTHNNFGICQQQAYSAVGEGLARVKAHFINQVQAGQSQVLETPYAEIASYDSLVTNYPNNRGFFDDLQSKNGQRFDESTKYHQDNNFVVAFGSSIEWVVQGGTNFWKDISEKYQSKVAVQISDTTLDLNLLKSSLQAESTTYFQYEVLCQKPAGKNLQKGHNFTVSLHQNNQVSKYLLRPAKHEVSIRVQCDPPKSVELYWSQENRSLSQNQMTSLPLHRVINQEKHHFVLANSEHYLRYLLFDAQSQVFFNHSSVATEVSTSDPKIARISLVNTSYAEAVVENRYDVRRVRFLDQTGTVYIRANSKGYYTRGGYVDQEPHQLPYQVESQMRVEIVNNVDIQPKYKAIYLNKDSRFTFRILHGSGKFSVSINNTQLADKFYVDGERTVTIIPKREGPISVKVEDLEIPDSQVSISELLISDITRLELDVPGTLIEQGSSMEINVTAFDTYGQMFDDDQYKLMKFTIEIEISQQRERGLATEIDPNNHRRFIAKGVEPGNYQVNAVAMKFSIRPDSEKARVSSEVQKIEVFQLLEISPGNLLLTPSMRYTLQILGGPSRSISSISTQTGSVEIRFDIENKRIATVDQFREITANEVGDTNLFYEIIQIRSGRGEITRRSIISKKTVPIRVRLVTSIDIPFNDQRTVYSGSMIKMFAILRHNEETFSHGIAPISYSWNSSNQNVLSLNLATKVSGEPQMNALATTVGRGALVVFQNKKIRDNENNNNNAVFMSHFNSSTIYTTGGKQGEVLVNVQLAIEYPELYRNAKNWFSKSVTLRVKEKLKVDIPEFINNPEKQTHLYLMPPNAYSKIETNKRTRLRLGYSQQSIYDYSTNSYQYKEVQTPIIQLVNEEGIRTFDKYGKVTVIIEENQAFSDQVVMLNVLITDIFTVTSKDVYQTLNFPLGSSMNIPLKFQNEHGHSFANNIEGIAVGFELSHPRVLSASLNEFNSSLQLKAEGSGECNVVVYLLKQPQIYDIFKVRVQSVVRPHSPVNVHVGAEISFKIMNDNQQVPASDEIIWSSSNPQALEINQKTGEANALNEGKVDILLSNNINAASIVHVSKVRAAEVDQASRKNLVINTDEYQGEVRIRIKLYLQDQIDELAPTVQYDGVTLIRQNVGLLCQSDNQDILKVRTEINDIEGYFCVLSYNKVGEQVPISSKVQVSAYAPNPQNPKNLKAALYIEKLLSFEVTYQCKIRVESKYARGLNLFGDQRISQIKIFSNTKFDTKTENYAAEDLGQDLLKVRVEVSQNEPTTYILTVIVPQEITHEFKSDIILTHPKTQVQTKIPVSFENASKKPTGKQAQVDKRQSVEKGFPRATQKEQKSVGMSPILQYLLVGLFVFSVFCYLVVNFFGLEPMKFLGDILSLKNPFNQRPGQVPQRQFQSQQSIVRQSTLTSQSFANFPKASQNSLMNGRSPAGVPGAVNRPRASNLGVMDISYDSGVKHNPSIYRSQNHL